MTKTNEALWVNISKFNFEASLSEYGFLTRLAAENNWTKYFTDKAVLEYKKFMYLATISKQMVSPSEIVDIVWHQHLIYTKSYADFCEVIGKKIHHVPSTKNHDEHDKFRDAMVYTRKQYQLEFGEEPRDI
jgi:hypothetical protein